MMRYIVDIDTGGTFTDCVVRWEGGIEWTKTDTTPHDLMEGVINSITEVAKKLGYDLKEFLQKTELVRISTTYAINTLLQRKGATLGVVVTEGFEDSLYWNGKENPIFGIIRRDLVRGVKSRVEPNGETIHSTPEEILSVVKELLDLGARTVVISIQNAHLNPKIEREMKKVVQSKYPPHFLGYVPVAISTEISLTPDNALRTNEVLLDSYVHHEMRSFLFGGEERLRKLGYNRPVYVAHNAGGVSRVPRTKALATFFSGPVAGVFGLKFLSDFYKEPNIIGIDIGGTSTDVGYIINGDVIYMESPEIAGIPIGSPTVKVESIGSGGGSIAKVVGGDVEVGPESAGAIPGPVCYDLGGTDPTVTDAFVVLGIIDPNNFLGGKRKLNKNKAENVIHNKIAEALGIDTTEAAERIISTDREKLKNKLNDELSGLKTETKKIVLVSHGGAGGLFTTWLAKELGIKKVYIPPFAATFSAWGISVMGIKQLYEKYLNTPIYNKGEFVCDINLLNTAIAELKEKAVHEFELEGHPLESVSYRLLLETSVDGKTSWISLDKPSFDSIQDLKEICQVDGVQKVNLERICLEAIYSLVPPEIPSYSLESEDASHALKGKREVFWEGTHSDINVYTREKLKPGNIIYGPAIIEGNDTTILVFEGQRYYVDKHLFGIVEEVE